jgi:hypothetical protein
LPASTPDHCSGHFRQRPSEPLKETLEARELAAKCKGELTLYNMICSSSLHCSCIPCPTAPLLCSDSFTKREAAAENLFIRQKEMERYNSNPWSAVPHADGVHSLKNLKEKLRIQRQHLDELDKHIKELEKESGGEQH